MLNNDALAQLRQLKQEIHDSRVRADGTVRGTQGRFGFVVLEDGREIYLAPEQMQRVFPDDRIAIEIVTGDDGKPVAQLDRLLGTELSDFTGQYVIRDNAHFVEPDLPRLSRWIFIPPKQRLQAQHGDYVRARITRHPFADGKAQARIEAIIGKPGQSGIEARYALARFRLADAALADHPADLLEPDWQQRRDITALPFITIDGAETRDMDDALYAEKQGDGWKLSVAIADPGAWIKPGSKLEQAIAARGTTVYLPGLTIPMLPEQLANERCSLLPGEERLALVCELSIDAGGAIANYTFSEAKIRSRAKLNYDGASLLLDSGADSSEKNLVDADSLRSLLELAAAAERLQQRRRADHIVLPERADYRAELGEDGKIVAYTRQLKTRAHLLVEECMIAANRCAADFLQGETAVFVAHRGFRAEKRENIAKLIGEQLPQLADAETTQLPGYVALMRTLVDTQHALPLREILFRSLERSQFRNRAEPHFGMGLPCYTTITSPIRKYNDYLLHSLIKAKLRGETPAAIDERQLLQLQECSDGARQAANLVEQWLACEYLQRQPAQQVRRAELVHVTSSGIVVRLLDTGIQGFVDTRHIGEKFSFDAVYMRLSSTAHTFQLEQQIDVTVAGIDMKKRSINFRLAEAGEVATQPAAAIE